MVNLPAFQIGDLLVLKKQVYRVKGFSNLKISLWDIKNQILKKFTIKNPTQAGSQIALDVLIDVTQEDLELVHDNPWFEEWVTAHSMLQMSVNIMKYEKPLLGGTVLNWKDIQEEAKARIEELKDRIDNEESEDLGFMIG